MSGTEMTFHSKRLSDFDLLRIHKAQAQGFDLPVTAYLNHVAIVGKRAMGVVFGHVRKGPLGRFDDGHYMRTSDIICARREGRFWVLNTLNSRYVIATFQRDIGRQTLRKFLMVSSQAIQEPPSIQ
ncbi:hypothetical protein F8N49_26450 [Pseudomonas sp. GXM4]|jgi:hypothetical protein|uniref:Uncharacterized protein n=1 Tax=Pseudomonas moraviensis R28-S TaxID=1395516 RepID=V8R572_9PSED|nr:MULTISPECIES: hypothetical protein [Pseudomonas]ETF06414.1 hypothetical protein PMO01_19115 [Pseudomonas moraviensis R28-S]KAB2516645.1 hypothetical protein F8N49_26450 [Pseudomonas sp. GXM4]MBI6950082.1 hypothetical protein [Pseudomonas koreensis]